MLLLSSNGCAPGGDRRHHHSVLQSHSRQQEGGAQATHARASRLYRRFHGTCNAGLEFPDQEGKRPHLDGPGRSRVRSNVSGESSAYPNRLPALSPRHCQKTAASSQAGTKSMSKRHVLEYLFISPVINHVEVPCKVLSYADTSICLISTLFGRWYVATAL